MLFPVGTSVVVLPLGRKRGVIVEAGRGEHYRVQVENAVVSCRETDLAAAPDERRKKGTARRHEHERTPPPDNDAATAPPGRLDLHGLTVEDALERVAQEIDRALRRGADRIEVVHGKGSGRIRDALHRQLAAVPVVTAFRLDPRNPGVTWIFL